MLGATNGRAEAMNAIVQGCAQQDAAACERLRSQLAARFDGTSMSDRAAALRLATRAAHVVRRADVATPCRDGNARACEPLTRILDGLFAADDASLDRSTDRALAHAVAEQALADVDGTAKTPPGEEEALSHFRSGEALTMQGRFAEAAREYQASFRSSSWPESLFAAAEAFQRGARAPQARCVYRLYIALFPRAPNASQAREQIAALGGTCPIAVREP